MRHTCICGQMHTSIHAKDVSRNCHSLQDALAWRHHCHHCPNALQLDAQVMNICIPSKFHCHFSLLSSSIILLATRKCLPDWDCIKNLPLCSLWKLLQIVVIPIPLQKCEGSNYCHRDFSSIFRCTLANQHELLFSTQWKIHTHVSMVHPLSSCR